MTSTTVEVYGASDDLIEVDGYLREEFSYDDEANLLAFSDGTVLSIEYNQEGLWRMAPLVKGSEFQGIDQTAATEEDYTDRAHFGSGLRWVMYGKAWIREPT